MDFDDLCEFVDLLFDPGTFEAIKDRFGITERQVSNDRAALSRLLSTPLPRLRSSNHREPRDRITEPQRDELKLRINKLWAKRKADQYRRR